MIAIYPADAAHITAAVTALRNGGLVGLPTETVYGLAADAENAQAVARIYAAKGRPADHPLIIHVPNIDVAQLWARAIPDYALALMTRLWPGPLTVVVPRSSRAKDFVTGAQDSVALRSPAHPVAMAVLEEFGGGIAAPSANRFGRVSPTTAQHVLDELTDVLDPARDMILDGGPCTVGLESTIVDCTGSVPRILRPGAIGHERLTDITGLEVAPFSSSVGAATPRVSGSLESHYAPAADVQLCAESNVVEHLEKTKGPHGLIALAEVPTPPGVTRLLSAANATDYAIGLYAALRRADELNLRTVIAVAPQDLSAEVATAILDRLTRAAF